MGQEPSLQAPQSARRSGPYILTVDRLRVRHSAHFAGFESLGKVDHHSIDITCQRAHHAVNSVMPRPRAVAHHFGPSHSMEPSINFLYSALSRRSSIPLSLILKLTARLLSLDLPRLPLSRDISSTPIGDQFYLSCVVLCMKLAQLGPWRINHPC
jgi:hypothetical protein